MRRILADAARPEPVDEKAPSIGWLRWLVDALQLDHP
jgi:hypothetical protein